VSAVPVLELDQLSLSFGGLRALSELFAGDFMEGLEVERSPQFNSWLIAQRRRFRGVHADVLERLAASFAMQGDRITIGTTAIDAERTYDVTIVGAGPAGLDVGPGGLGDHRLREGGEEAANDELVDTALRALERARVDRLRRVDRRVVGGLLLAPGRLQGLVEQALRGLELGDRDQFGDQRLGVAARRHAHRDLAAARHDQRQRAFWQIAGSFETGVMS